MQLKRLAPTALLATLAAVCLCAPAAGAAPHLSSLGSFDQPVYVTAPPGDPHRVMVVEQTGRVRVIRDGSKLSTPFVDLSDDVVAGGETGLLSIAFAPDYATSHRLYAMYTADRADDPNGDVIVVQEMRTAGNPDAVDPSTRRSVLTIQHPDEQNHNGGQLQFGPDGMLYVGTGDGGSGNDPPNNAQSCSALLGKVLRIDPRQSGTSAYTVPGGNACGGGSRRPEVWAYGLRNPWRFSFDRGTGDLVIGDVGQGAREEIDFAPAGTGGGANYGWRCIEGTSITGLCGSTPSGAVAPVLEKDHSGDGYCAIVGGYVVRDPALGSLFGRYIYGDYCANGLRTAMLKRPRVTDDAALGLSVPQLTGFGEDSCGHLYATSQAGGVYRLDGDSFAPCTTGGDGGTRDTRPPRVWITAKWPKQLAKRRVFPATVHCDELCGVTVKGTVTIAGSTKTYRLSTVTRLVAPGKRVTASLTASKNVTAAVTKALRRHRTVKASLTVRGVDTALNSGSAKRVLRSR